MSGSNPELPDVSGNTPVHSSAFRGSDGALRLLLLLSGGGRADPDRQNETGFSALHFAAQEGRPAAARTLLEFGAEAALTNDDGETPADLARANGHQDVLEILEG